MTQAAERSESRDLDATMALLDGVVYGDLFDCAVGLDEIVRYSRRASGRDDVATVLGSPTVRRTVVRQGDYVTLAGREELVERRKETRARARRLQRRAQRMGRLLGLVPFVRGLILTGSVAAEAATEDADIDLLVIVAPSRLAFVFLLLGGFSRLTRRRLYCANYYMADDRLQVDRRNLFIAREIVQARPLDEGGERFFRTNDWIVEYLPNASISKNSNARRRPGRLQKALELPFRGRFGRWCESFAARVARRRIEAHYVGGREEHRARVQERFESGHELRFHNHPDLRGLRDRYADHRATLEADLKLAIDEGEVAR